jgi:hypothetical protein
MIDPLIGIYCGIKAMPMYNCDSSTSFFLIDENTGKLDYSV